MGESNSRFHGGRYSKGHRPDSRPARSLPPWGTDTERRLPPGATAAGSAVSSGAFETSSLGSKSMQALQLRRLVQGSLCLKVEVTHGQRCIGRSARSQAG
jgi:hypothetical protein